MGKRTNTAVWLENQKRWQINVQKDNTRRTFTSSKAGRTGQREANKKADEWLDDNISSTNLRCDTLLDDFLLSIEGTVAPETVVKYKSIAENWLKPYIGHKKIGALTEQDLQNILNSAANHGVNRKKGLAKKSINNILDIIRQFLKYCRFRRVTTLSSEFLNVPAAAPKGEKRILMPDSLRKLFNCQDTFIYGKMSFEPFIYAFRFTVLTGVRPGELVGLQWKDVGKDGNIYLKRSINTSKRETTGKNENSKRAFGLNEYTKSVLEEQRKICSSNESVFNIHSYSTFAKRWTRFCKSNNIEYVSLYELRHTFVSIAKELTDGEIRPLVGHSRNMDTYGVYSHPIESDKARTADKLEKIYDGLFYEK